MTRNEMLDKIEEFLHTHFENVECDCCLDGVKVYRFYDGSGPVYFTNVNGITRTERSVTTGKVTQTEPVVTYCNRKP